jgi:hypothetical protein
MLLKKILPLLLFITSLSTEAQVSKYDYLYFCDQLMVNTNNSVPYLQGFYADLKQFKLKSSFRFRYFDSYNFIRQPDESAFKKINGGSNSIYKTTALELWKLYNQCYLKNGEIVAYLRLEDYKTDLEKGFGLVREMQQLQIAMGKARDQLAGKIASEASSLPTSNGFIKPYQLLMKAILHEEDLISKRLWDLRRKKF